MCHLGACAPSVCPGRRAPSPSVAGGGCFLPAEYQLTRESILITHCSLLITHYSLLITHYSLLITHYSLLITHYSLQTMCVTCNDDLLFLLHQYNNNNNNKTTTTTSSNDNNNNSSNNNKYSNNKAQKYTHTLILTIFYQNHCLYWRDLISNRRKCTKVLVPGVDH